MSLMIFMLAYFAVALVWPSVRLWRRTGIVPLTFLRSKAPTQRAVGASFGILIALILAWVAINSRRPGSPDLWPVPLWVGWSGWSFMWVGLLVTLLAQVQMGASWRIGIDSERTELVANGLFQVVRNPIFSSMLLTLLGLVLLTPHWISFLGWLTTASVISVQVRMEERHLLSLHGEAYRDYAGRVGRFMPGVGRIRFEREGP